jgi:hypothetical protein
MVLFVASFPSAKFIFANSTTLSICSGVYVNGKSIVDQCFAICNVILERTAEFNTQCGLSRDRKDGMVIVTLTEYARIIAQDHGTVGSSGDNGHSLVIPAHDLEIQEHQVSLFGVYRLDERLLGIAIVDFGWIDSKAIRKRAIWLVALVKVCSKAAGQVSDV